MNNCSILVNQTSYMYDALATSYSVVMLVGLPLNALSLWILLKRHGLKSSNTVFMANLALSDFVLALPLPLRIYYYATATWPFGAVICTINTTIFRVNICTSAIFITFISVDRLLAVVFPLRSRVLRTSRSAGIACAATWLSFVVLSVPTAIAYTKKVDACRGEVCFEVYIDEKNSIALSAIGSLVIFALLMVNVVSTAMVMRTLHRRKMDSIGHSKGRVMLIFGVNLLMFVAFFVPLSMVLFLMPLGVIDRDVLKWIICYATFSVCLDPLIYYFSIDAFWKRKAEHTLDTA